jgi:zinc transport system ATP-binding protein
MNEEAIVLEHVYAEIEGLRVLEDISLTVNKRDFYAIIGPNGGGKTTLIRLILGLIQQKSGTIRVFGGEPKENRHLLGYVPQFHSFDFHYPVTLKEMVLSGLLGSKQKLFTHYSAEDQQTAEDVLSQMGIADLGNREIGALSGGERQRAIIARALVGRPLAILLDEPTVYVDAPAEQQFFRILNTLKKEMAVILVTHDIGVVSDYATKVACLNQHLYTHDSAEITEDMLVSAYQCPVELIAHGLPHRVFRAHDKGGSP